LFFLIVNRLDATHVDRIIEAFRIHRVTLYAMNSGATPAGVQIGPSLDWSDSAAVQVKGSQIVGIATGTAAPSIASIVPPADSLVSKWISAGTGNVIDVTFGANLAVMFEIDLEFQLDPDVQSSAVAVTSTSSATLQQRTLFTNFVPVAWEAYVP
jgi:hypothetical protein